VTEVFMDRARETQRRIVPCALLLLILLVVPLNLFGLPPVERTVLPNGLVLLTSEDHSLPFVTFQLLLGAGSASDPKGQEGIAALTARGLLLGTAGRSVEALNEELDFLGASLNASAGRDHTVVGFRALTKDLAKGFDLFLDVLLQPTFPTDEIGQEITKTLAAIKGTEDYPGEVAEREFFKLLYGDGSFAHPPEGTEGSVKKLTRDMALRYYESFYKPNNAILVIVGDISPELLKSLIIPRLSAWERSTIPPGPNGRAYAGPTRKAAIEGSVTQANIIIGHKGITRGDPDYYAATVMNYILGGGGFRSRLVDQVREKRGLAYAVSSSFDAGKANGEFQVVLQTKNDSARQAIDLVLAEMERIRKDGVSDDELEGAKKYLIGSFPLRLNTQSRITGFLALVEYFGLGLDYPENYPSYIEAVTKEDVLRAARRHLYPDKYIQVVVADLKKAGLK
jgi:zinc protease